jgi:hypothetical protein
MQAVKRHVDLGLGVIDDLLHLDIQGRFPIGSIDATLLTGFGHDGACARG